MTFFIDEKVDVQKNRIKVKVTSTNKQYINK